MTVRLSHRIAPATFGIYLVHVAVLIGLREAMSDRHGTVELEPLLWQAPPLPGAHVVVARDMGPLVNARVRSALPGYTARVGVDGGTQSPMQVLGYEEGMERLWGGAAGLNAGGE